METAITNFRWESQRARGVVFDATNEHGTGEFLVGMESLADLVKGHQMKESDYLDAFESNAHEISEAAGRYLAARAVPRGQLTVIQTEDLPSLR
ncbi:DUF1488 family protein [Variovorax sp. tm]|uniref:DUF1488 family protein n=1 Tax=Variovorax atrisoli TaxID=3394203 RepID=UPI003A7F71E3